MKEKGILKEAISLKEELIDIRRWLHSNAEVGFNINKTASFVKDKLEKIGCEVQNCGNNGLTCLIGKNTDKVFLLRADMDALPITEETDLSFSCPDNAMHACGHDMHTTMLLGAAIILKEHEDELQGSVKLMFQPAEEIFSGSKNMIENGILENPKVNAGMMIHVLAAQPMKSGVTVVSNGVSAPSAEYFTINVHGRSSHGSAPQEAVDALTIASHIVIALQEISARELGFADEALITIGTMKSGTAGNVIADSAVLEGTLRVYDEALKETVKKRIVEICDGIATAFRGKVDVVYGNGCPTLLNNEELSEKITEYSKELLSTECVINAKDIKGSSKSGGSEDFAYISHEIPTVMLALCAGDRADGFKYPLHHPKCTFDENVLPIGAALHAYNAIKWLENN
ncbi:MAG: M20 family metallopeptidase [Acutalibacteraceae bacterium]